MIVEAVAISANTAGSGLTGAPKSPLAKIMELAMSDAVAKAYAEGVTEPEAVRERMMEAREAVKARAAELLAAASNPEG